MPRSTKEWIGRDDNSAIPPRVKLRVAQRADYTCAICGRGAKPGDADHREPVVFSTPDRPLNREGNLQWVCVPCHKSKTRKDVADKARAAKAQKRVAGIERKGRPVPGSKRSKWAMRYNRATGRFEAVPRHPD